MQVFTKKYYQMDFSSEIESSEVNLFIALCIIFEMKKKTY